MRTPEAARAAAESAVQRLHREVFHEAGNRLPHPEEDSEPWAGHWVVRWPSGSKDAVDAGNAISGDACAKSLVSAMRDAAAWDADMDFIELRVYVGVEVARDYPPGRVGLSCGVTSEGELTGIVVDWTDALNVRNGAIQAGDIPPDSKAGLPPNGLAEREDAPDGPEP